MVLRQPRLLIVMFVLLLAVPCPVTGATEPASSKDIVSEARSPGLSELGTRSTQLASFTEKSSRRLELLADVEQIRTKLQEWEVKVQEMRQEVAALGSPDDWYIDRLTLHNYQFGLARRALEDIQRELTVRQQEIEKIRSRQKEEVAFWKDWVDGLKQQGDRVPEKTVDQLSDQLVQLDKNLHETAETLIPLQEKVSTIERSVIEEQDRFSRALSHLRKATFRKNSFSFFNLEFYRQFNSSLWNDLKVGARSALSLDFERLKTDSWIYAVFFLVFIFLAKSVRQHRSRFEGTEEWQFVLNHPWAAGSFVAAVGIGNLLPAPPAVITFALLVAGVMGATILATALIPQRQQAVILMLAAFFYLVTAVFRFITLPQPLFRVYIAVFALVAIPLLSRQIQLTRQGQIKERSFFRALLRFSVVVLFLSLAGQVAGYVNFASWLFQAVFETGMIILFVFMGLRLGNGGIDFLLAREGLRRRKFFKKYRQEIAERLEFFLKLMIYFYAFLSLMPVWRIFSGPVQAWEYIAQTSIPVGETQLSLQMVVLALVSLYLALQVSWLLQAMCETQVFYRKSVDRGVRDAIKKLIHYGVVLVGFLIALSSLGLNLQHFVVILGALGVGIGFGLQDIVNNFLSGIILLFERPIKVGDGILVDGEYGTVKYIGLRSTIVETLDQSELIVPNAQMISQKVTNWTLSTRRVRLVIPVGVAYGSPVPQVLTILAEVSAAHEEVLAEPEPSPIFIAFGDSSLNFELRVWIGNIDGRPRIKSELLQQIDTKFREAGIQIPFPQRDLHVRSIDRGIISDVKST